MTSPFLDAVAVSMIKPWPVVITIMVAPTFKKLIDDPPLRAFVDGVTGVVGVIVRSFVSGGSG